MSSLIQADFLIVGAGPIGAASALALAGISPEIKVILVDKQIFVPLKEQQRDTRVFAINQGSRSLLEDVGAWQSIEQAGICAYKNMHVWDAEGTGFLDFSASELCVDQLGHIIEAGVIQQALEEKLASQSNIRQIRPAEIESLTIEDNLAIVRLNQGEEIQSQLLVAADGAQSFLRQSAGIKTQDDDCQQQALVANIRLEKSHENCAWQIFRPTGPLAFLPLFDSTDNTQERSLCSIVWTLDNEQAHSNKALVEGDFERELERACEGRFGSIKLISEIRSFPLIQRHAQIYSDKALVLVGDSAHSIHPLAGLGANLGFQDIAALTKELTRAHARGIAFSHPKVLARYQRSRKLDNELTIKLMALFRDSFTDRGMLFNAARNMGMKSLSKMPAVKNMIARQAAMTY